MCSPIYYTLHHSFKINLVGSIVYFYPSHENGGWDKSKSLVLYLSSGTKVFFSIGHAPLPNIKA